MLWVEAVTLSTVPGLFWAPEPDQIRIASHQGPRPVAIRVEPPAGQSATFLFGVRRKVQGGATLFELLGLMAQSTDQDIHKDVRVVAAA